MITLKSVSKAFGDKELWANLDASFPTGTISVLTGISGSGKSTLLNCIGALDLPDSGAVDVNGTTINRLSARRRRIYRRDKVGYLFQDYALVPDRSVEYNIKLAIPKTHPRPRTAGPARASGAAHARRMPRARSTARADLIEQSLNNVGLPGYAKKEVHTLSGGEQQRVALARLLVKNPPIVLADEPTGALDGENARLVMNRLKDFADGGATVIVATHSDFVAQYADQRLNLSN